MERCARPWLFLDQVEINLDSYLDDFKLHLLPLARPEWSEKELAVKIFDSGLTNKLMAIYPKKQGLMESREEAVLLRVNGAGSEKLIDRVDEIRCMLAMGEVGIGPPVYAQLQNGLCYGFTPGRQMGLSEVKEECVWKKIAELVARLHVVTVPEYFQNRKPQLWVKVDKWMQSVPREFEDPQKQKSFVEGVGSIQALEAEIDWLRALISASKSPVVFCHNDLLIANLIIDDKTGEVHLVDYEYGGPNFLAFDIADHFCEFAAFAAAFRKPFRGIDEVNYDLYPDEDFQKKWLRHYLNKRRQLLEVGAKVTNEDELHIDQEVDVLYREVNRFVLAAHLFWTVWALLQALHSNIEFDYVSYAGVRFKEYLRRKTSFSTL